MILEVWSPAPEEQVRALLEPAKRGCYVSGVLKAEINFAVELRVAAGIKTYRGRQPRYGFANQLLSSGCHCWLVQQM